LAPLLFILLSLTSLFGKIAQEGFLKQVKMINPEVTQVLLNILNQDKIHEFSNAGIGLSGMVFFIFLSSLVFNQLRNSFDIIMDNHLSSKRYSILEVLKKRGLVILVALMMCLLFTLSLFIGPILKFLIMGLESQVELNSSFEKMLNVVFLTTLFTGLFFFTPSFSKGLKISFYMGIVSSIGFMIGNYFTGLYMSQIALTSLYGAAGAILIFLLWAFYSALTVFLVLEVFMFFEKKKGKRQGLLLF
jgi:membrane protein